MGGTPRTRHAACADCIPGSNNWVISGTHTASGKPLLSNDMHLSLTVPNIWYMADLRAPGFHAAGVTLPGMPFVIAGHNEHVAWGFTALYADVQDLYIENLQGNNYEGGDLKWKPLAVDHETIHVRGRKDVLYDVRLTDHGPLLDPIFTKDSRAIALKWTLYDTTLNSIPLYALNTASNWTEFSSALSQWCWPTQNVVYSDDQGHIGYHAVGKMPIRSGGEGVFPSRSHMTPEFALRMGHDDFCSAGAAIPTSPSTTCPTPSIRPRDFWPPRTPASPATNQNIRSRMSGQIPIAPSASTNCCRAATTLHPPTCSPCRPTSTARWTRRWGIASPTPSIMRRRRRPAPQSGRPDAQLGWPPRRRLRRRFARHATRQTLCPMLLEPKLGNDDAEITSWSESNFADEEIVMHAKPDWLPPNYKDWDAFLADAVRRGHERGESPRRRHASGTTVPGTSSTSNIRFKSCLTSAGFAGTGEQPLSGDTTTVKQVGRAFGPSQRFTMDWSNIDGSTEDIVLGESGNPYSPYFRDQWDDYYNGRTFALPYTPADVAANAQHTLRLMP